MERKVEQLTIAEIMHQAIRLAKLHYNPWEMTIEEFFDAIREHEQWLIRHHNWEEFGVLPDDEVKGGRKFALGRIDRTPKATEAVKRNSVDTRVYIHRHWGGDWGDIHADDRADNELSLEKGDLLSSAYRLADGTRICIVTNPGRTLTTIMTSEEYHSRPWEC